MIRILFSSFIILFGASLVGAESYTAPKITPDGVSYPMIRTKLYPHKKERNPPPELQENFESVFGVRRWQMPISREKDLLDRTLEESRNFLGIYGGYGVLGHGEDVFTDRAAAWRKLSNEER